MEYKVINSGSSSDLSEKVSMFIKQGWKPIGSHQVVIRREQNRFRGDQHIDTLNDLEYTQTLTREIEVSPNEITDALKNLKTDAQMALDGSWDRSDEGFEAQIFLIDKILDKLENIS